MTIDRYICQCDTRTQTYIHNSGEHTKTYTSIYIYNLGADMHPLPSKAPPIHAPILPRARRLTRSKLHISHDRCTGHFKTNRTHCFPSKIRTVHSIYGNFLGNHIPSMHGISYQFHHHILKIVEMRVV